MRRLVRAVRKTRISTYAYMLEHEAGGGEAIDSELQAKAVARQVGVSFPTCQHRERLLTGVALGVTFLCF